MFNLEAERAKNDAVQRMLSICDNLSTHAGLPISKKLANSAALASSQYRAAVDARNIVAQPNGDK